MLQWLFQRVLANPAFVNLSKVWPMIIMVLQIIMCKNSNLLFFIPLSLQNNISGMQKGFKQRLS